MRVARLILVLGTTATWTTTAHTDVPELLQSTQPAAVVDVAAAQVGANNTRVAPLAVNNEAVRVDGAVRNPFLAPGINRSGWSPPQKPAEPPPRPRAQIGLMLLVGAGLIGHQLRRKHRLLRPHRFATNV